MVQNLTKVIQDRKQNKLILISLIYWTFKYSFYKLRISKSSDARKKLCLFPCTPSVYQFTHYKNGIVRNYEYLWKVLTVFLTLRLGNPSLLQCMCKSEHAYTLSFGLHPEDIAIKIEPAFFRNHWVIFSKNLYVSFKVQGIKKLLT